MKLLKNIKKNIYNSIFLNFLSDGNQFLGHLPKLKKSKIYFKGSNNILFCEKGVLIENSEIIFNGNNSLIYIGSGNHRYDITINNNSVFYVGKNNYFNTYEAKTKIIISEEKNVLIGNGNLFSFGIFVRTADPHLIYNAENHERLNLSKSVYIGDHVWIGQDVTLLKGTQIYSGSIIGAKSLVSNKVIPSNEVWGGVPVRALKKNIFWVGSDVHSWTKEDTINNMRYNSDDYIYNSDENAISFDEIEINLSKLTNASDKLSYLQKLTQHKNRFCKIL